MNYVTSKVIYNRKLSRFYYKIGLVCPEIPSLIQPGQFLMIRPWSEEEFDPLLNRPFGIYRVIAGGEGLEVFYKVVGRGTRMMADLRPGEEVKVLGPLGNGFPISRDWKDIFIISGGVGIAPFYHFIEEILMTMDAPPSITLYHGERVIEDVVCIEDFEALGVGIRVSTEDGKMGFKGMVSENLKVDIIDKGLRPSVIFACGPKGMLKEVAQIAIRKDLPCYVSIDRVMACGIGTCLGCVIKLRRHCDGEDREGGDTGYERVCMEGPVFDARRVVWEEL